MRPYKVTLCALNSRYSHTSLSVRCLRAAIDRTFDRALVTCTVVEGTVNESQDAVLSRLEAERPTLLGLSCYIWNVKEMLSLANDYKALHPEVHIVLGGPEVSYRPAEILASHPAVDYVLSGEGEEPLPALIRVLLSERSFDEVSALSYRREDGAVAVGVPHISSQDPGSPYRGMDVSGLQGRIAYLESSRGCPYRCTFCLSGRCGTVRYFDMERVKSDLLHLAENGVRIIKFVDRTFNADRSYAHAFWQWIATEYGRAIPKGTRVHFEISGECLSDASFSILSAMPVGAIQLEVGLQSFHPPTLRAIRRNPDTGRLEENIRRLTALKNIHTHIDLIAGLPYENYATFTRGFDRAYSLGANMLQLGFLKLLPGAPMTEEGEVQYPCAYSPEPPYEVIETDAISAAELDKLRLAEDALERLGNSGRFSRTLGYLIDTCGLRPYELFYGFAVYVREHGTAKALDPYTNAFATYASALSGVEAPRLLDFMVYDRMATNSSGVIPDGIRNFDKRLKQIRLCLNADPSTRELPGIRRTLAALRDGDTVLWADYRNPDPVTGEYTVHACSMRMLLSRRAESEVT
ncbi:MAG: DUF4080 domain-containing protein [Clostridia bacterium]|nr:DUF4080 domain-containing protein [Clostridia bacterium]